MTKINSASCVVLAGGLSTRIGRDKGRLELAGKPLALRVLTAMTALFEEVVYATNASAPAPHLPGVTIALDEVPHLGPLGGILAGLKAVSSARRAFVIGYDMPFAALELVRFLVAYDTEADVVVPLSDGRPEPLFAVYARGCIDPISAQLAKGNRRIIDFYSAVNVVTVDESESRRYDPDLISFHNVNTWSDYEKASNIVKDGGRQ